VCGWKRANKLDTLEDWIARLLHLKGEAKSAIVGRDWELIEALEDAMTDIDTDIRRGCRILRKLTQRANVPKGTDDRKNKQIYNAMITDLDDNLGRITRELDELGIAEDTIICFSSDHGDMLASQGLQGKNVPYEESINIPFIMRYPRKIEAGQKNDALMNSVDVMPTLLGLCGVSIPKAVEGSDLSPIILGKGGKKPEAVLLQKIAGVEGKKGLGPWRGVRTARYTYARTRDKGYVLFDNEKDPYQMNNLIDKPEAKDLQDKMEAELQKLMKRIGDKFETQDAYLARIKGRVGRKWAKMQEASE